MSFYSLGWKLLLIGLLYYIIRNSNGYEFRGGFQLLNLLDSRNFYLPCLHSTRPEVE